MLDLDTIIRQQNLIRQYQGDEGTGVTTIPPSRVGPMEGFYGAPGPGATATGDIWNVLPEVKVEEERESPEEITARYREMFNQGVIPEIPYGKRVHGYESPYTDPSETLASVFKVKRDDKGLPLERYDERDIPMLEWLYGITESATNINAQKEAELKANAPKEADYNLGTYTGRLDFKKDTEKYWEGVQDDKMAGDKSGKGYYKNPTTGEWTVPTGNEIQQAYFDRRNNLIDQESSLAIQAGVQTPPGSEVSRTAGKITGGDALMALAAIPAVIEPSPAGETAWAVAAAKYAPALLAAGYTATQAWDMLTKQGAFSDATQANERFFKSQYESLTSTSLGERVWETVNGVQGLYVPTVSGSVFVSKDEVESRSNVFAKQSEADKAYEEAYPTRVIDPSEVEVGEEVSPLPPDPDDDNLWDKIKKTLKKGKNWSDDKVSKFRKAYKPIRKYTGGDIWRKAGNIPYIGWATGGRWPLSRWGYRWAIASQTGLLEAVGIEDPDMESVYSKKDIETYNTMLDIMNRKDVPMKQKVKEAEAYKNTLSEDYIKDSILWNVLQHSYPDTLWESESGFKGKKKFKTGGVIRQFQEGGVMSRILKYQGNLDPNIAYQYDTLPVDWGGFQQQPAITDVDNTYGNYPMVNWDQPGVSAGTNIQPTQEELNQAGFQNVQTWRDWVNTQPGFAQYDWGKLGYWGPKHQRAWNWTKSASPAVVEDTDVGETDGGDVIETGDVKGRQGLTEEEKYKMKLQMQQKSMKGILGKGLELGASVLPYAFAWGQANKMEDEAHEFLDIPDIKSPEVHIKAPINEINQQIEDVDTTMNAVVENLKNKGASASAILAAEKQRRQAKDQLNAKKEDLLLKADAESQKLTGAMKLDAAKQNQVKDIKMKLEEMDFRTATKKAKIDIMSKLVKTVTGYVLDQKKMYSDKSKMAIVSAAILAGTGIEERETWLKIMSEYGITEDDIREHPEGDDWINESKLKE